MNVQIYSLLQLEWIVCVLNILGKVASIPTEHTTLANGSHKLMALVLNELQKILHTGDTNSLDQCR